MGAGSAAGSLALADIADIGLTEEERAELLGKSVGSARGLLICAAS